MRREEERELRREPVDVEPSLDRGVDVGNGVREREGELLHRIGAGLADVIPADRDRVPSRMPLGAITDEVGRETHRWPRREDVGPARDVFLQDVVLRRTGDAIGRDALPLRDCDVHGKEDGRRRIDSHRRRHVAHRYAVKEAGEIVERADRDADLPHFAGDALIVRVVAHLRRQVEGSRVRLLGGAEAGVLAHRPEASAVHRRLDAAGVRRLAGKARINVVGVEDRRQRRAICGLEFRALGNALGGLRVFRALPFGGVVALLRHDAMVPTYRGRKTRIPSMRPRRSREKPIGL